MRISSIRQQVKRTDRYSIYVDDSYAFSLSESALLKSGLASGQELSPADLERYKSLSAEDKLFNQVLRYVAMRQRTVQDVRLYLRRKDAPQPFVDPTIDRLTELGLLSDTAFANSYVRDRQTLKPTSRRKLQLELRQKGIDTATAEAAMVESEYDEAASLRALIEKKRRQTKYQDDQKLMQYLARQGYRYDDITSALT